MKFHRHSYPSCITSILITMAILVFMGIDYSHASAQCRPLLILIEGGGGGKAGRAGQALADHFRRTYSGHVQINVMDNDQFWFLWNFRRNNFDYQVNIVNEQITKGRHFPIVIIGHSLGGSVAFEFATRVSTDLLVTLDPVSRPVPTHERPQWVRHWIHVYAKGDNWLMYDWQHQDGADQNIHLPKTRHSDVRSMYNQVAETVDAYLRCRRY